LDKQVNVIVFAIHLGEHSPKPCNGFAIEYVIAVFGYEDQCILIATTLVGPR
jgi:hypothetical protein